MRPALSTSDGASIRLSARFPRAGHFLLLVQEKVTKENTPRMPRRLRRCARVRPGFVERTSLCVQRTRAHRARDLYRHFRSALAAANGDPRSSNRVRASPLSLLRAGARCSGFSGPHCIAAAAGGNARRGGAMDRAASVVWTGMCSQRNPAADANPARRMRVGRNALGRVSLLTFSARAEKVRRSPAGRVEAFAPETKQTRTGFPPAQE